MHHRDVDSLFPGSCPTLFLPDEVSSPDREQGGRSVSVKGSGFASYPAGRIVAAERFSILVMAS